MAGVVGKQTTTISANMQMCSHVCENGRSDVPPFFGKHGREYAKHEAHKTGPGLTVVHCISDELVQMAQRVML